MRILALALLTLLPASPIGDDPPAKDFAVHCGKLFVGDGTEQVGAWLIIRHGKIAEVLPAGSTPPPDLPVLDASDRVVMPGIVAADTDLSGHGDAVYTFTPDFVAIDGFDFMRPYRRALSGGVTTVYLAPGRSRLIPGQGSVVKLHGDDMVQRVLAEASCLRITLGKEGTAAPAVFEPTPHPTADNPLLPARKQYPSSRLSQSPER